MDVKLKSVGDDQEQKLSGHELVATVSVGFFKTTILTDIPGSTLEVKPNETRKDIVTLVISFSKENTLTINDIANFITAFQEAVNEVNLFASCI